MMSRNRAYDEDQSAFAEVVAQFCAAHRDAIERPVETALAEQLWRGLADLGVLGLGTSAGGGGVMEISAVMESLGAAGCPGPLAATFMAGQLLHEEMVSEIIRGEALVALGDGPQMPWASSASVFIEWGEKSAWVCQPTSDVVPVVSASGEPWGSLELERHLELDGVEYAEAVGDIAVSAYLVGCARRLIVIAAEWARTRDQFGKPIGTFQGVAFPLADSDMRVAAATALTRRVAQRLQETPDARVPAAKARVSASNAALHALDVAHQVLGALGFTEEGPIGPLRPRLVQALYTPPGMRRCSEVVRSSLDGE